MTKKQLAVQRRRARLDKLKASYAASRNPASPDRHTAYTSEVGYYRDIIAFHNGFFRFYY